MKHKLVFFLEVALLISFNAVSQFSKDIEQSYLFYNKARILESAGHIDSAAIYMKQSIRLNNRNGQTRDYAWSIFLKAGRYNDAIEDAKDYYTKNPLPENADDVFFVYDQATTAKARESKEIKAFIASYEDLKKSNSRTVKTDNELKRTVDNCMLVDQFARADIWSKETKADTYYSARLINYADSTNMETVASYIRQKGFPGSVEYEGVTMSGNFVNLFTHFLQEPATYSKLPAWRYLDSAIQQAVYNGIFPARIYLHFLDNRHIVQTRLRQLYGTYSSLSYDIDKKKRVRVYSTEIDDIAHVDERRHKWLQPTLYEESLIDTMIRLPENYRR